MFFTLLLGLSAFLVAGSAAYFSVLGIATLFIGSYYQVMIMAGSLEFGKLVATSYLYRYWNNTVWWLKLYMCIAVLTLMGITSIGVFGYLSAAYQINSSKFDQIDSEISLLSEQKNSTDKEIEQINSRIEVLNKTRLSQEQRLPSLSKTSASKVYADIESSAKEIKGLTERIQSLQTAKLEKDQQIINLNSQIAQTKDIGTFKFVADAIKKPLDTIVIAFICLLICVFDPLAVALVLAFNVASSGNILKENTKRKDDNKDDGKDENKNDDNKKQLEPELLTEVNPNQIKENPAEDTQFTTSLDSPNKMPKVIGIGITQ